ncbi:hypothetical protein [Kocuria turfanensis]|uniref:Uncharacterized protein n=1 Tax=Kocuria turfanensis TaxID=388357 RepID=A0A512IGS5_9MICC|nr:hypothetical protein [Kocuria turfanensis]GEO96913.1 hypothetical protein KTU01_30360 [Kocuria turfanensis]
MRLVMVSSLDALSRRRACASLAEALHRAAATEAAGADVVPAGPATVLAATGADLDAAELTGLLAACQLTEEELRSGITGLSDPFGISSPN